ncbi:HlyD family secretion protein [Azospirillum sp. SYSU D00513]|uniref:HlyD family efflux transporter periplasmic adaptor subunit n=1 Tax=Azospirillum sp. SYSU D00513 TaxID=2812561 RepID=UPI001A96C1D3|nr:HlyD family secretion protein [Azospirillum sp. SYSU D00513]
MGYLLSTLAVAVSLALAAIATETSTKYLARYVIENESQDLGASLAPATAAASQAAVPPVSTEPASEFAPEPAAERTAREEVIPILASSGLQAAASPATVANAVAAPDTASGDARPAKRPAWLPVQPAAPLDARPASSFDSAEAQAVLGMVRDTPHRRSDGAVFLPVTTQRLFSMRWQVTRETTVPVTREIPGQVITNPGTGTLVQSSRTGVIEPLDGRFPYLGMLVRRGDLLGVMRPVMSVSERAQIDARIQQLGNQIALTNQQIVRLKEVLFVRYRENKIEALRVEAEGYRRELATLQDALNGREELRASADGVISRVGTVAGGHVDANQILFEIVDPKALWVEAAAYDPAIAADIQDAAALTPDGQAVDLEFVGGGLTLSNQAIPLRFRVVGAARSLAVGQPVTVFVRGRKEITGVPVAAASVVRDGDGRTVVWERTAGETFVAHHVRAEKLAGDVMLVRTGLASGARIVSEGASVLNQVR